MSGPEDNEWDLAAASFDDQPDHGLADPDLRSSWRALLARHMPNPPARVLDLGCGTGTLSALLASMGFTVTGVDSSEAMLAQAQAKARRVGVRVGLVLGDAASPPLASGFDVLLCRHVLWTLPEPDAALARWKTLLRQGGRLLLIEGFWSSGAGIPARDLVSAVERIVGDAKVEHLTDEALWGRAISDERYLVQSNA